MIVLAIALGAVPQPAVEPQVGFFAAEPGACGAFISVVNPAEQCSASCGVNSASIQVSGLLTQIVEDAREAQKLGDEHEELDFGDSPPSDACLESLVKHGARIVAIVGVPHYWAPSGDGGYCVEYHDKGADEHIIVRVSRVGDVSVYRFEGAHQVGETLTF